MGDESSIFSEIIIPSSKPRIFEGWLEIAVGKLKKWKLNISKSRKNYCAKNRKEGSSKK